MEQTKEYYAFISYKSDDVEWAIWVQHELEHYHLPASYNGRTDIRKELRPVFRDIDELSAGNLPEQIKQALVNSRNLIVICSPQAAKSPWVNQEVKAFISLGRTDRIFPFIVEGNSPKEFFPSSLLSLPKNEERLGGDVCKNGRDAAFVKVVAGMLGVGFDSLWNRYEKEKAEEERKQREQKKRLLREQSRYVSMMAEEKTGDGDTYLARRLLLNVIPIDLSDSDVPITIEAEAALRNADLKNEAIFRKKYDTILSAFSPNGSNVVSVTEDGNIHIWNSHSGVCLRSFDGEVECRSTIMYSPDGNNVMYGAIDNTIRIVNSFTGKCILNLIGHDGTISSASYSNDGRLIVSSSEDKTVRIWDVATGSCIKILKGHKGPVWSAVFSPDKKHILSASSDKTFRIWNVDSGKMEKKKKRHRRGVCSANYSPDGTMIATASLDGEIIVWEAEGLKIIAKIIEPNTSFDSVAFTNDGKNVLVSTLLTGLITMWDVASKTSSQPFSGRFQKNSQGVFSPDGKRFAASAKVYGGAKLYNTPGMLWDYKIKAHSDSITCIKQSNDGCLLAFASKDGTISLWNYPSMSYNKSFYGHTNVVDSISFTPDNKYIISGSRDETIKIWDIKYGRCVRTIQHKGWVYSVDIDYDRKIIATASFKTIELWDFVTGNCYRVLRGHESRVSSVMFCQGGKELLSSSWDGTLRVWNINSGLCTKTMVGHYGRVNSARTINNGENYYISASCDKSIIIWNQYGQYLKRINDFYYCVKHAAFSSDGRYIVSVSNYNLNVWDFKTCTCVFTIINYERKVFEYAMFGREDRTLIAGTNDGFIYIWEFLPLQEIVDRTRERFKDNPLTPEERRQYYLE